MGVFCTQAMQIYSCCTRRTLVTSGRRKVDAVRLVCRTLRDVCFSLNAVLLECVCVVGTLAKETKKKKMTPY